MICENCKTGAEVKNKVVQLTLHNGRAICGTCIKQETGWDCLFPLLLIPGKCSHDMEQRHLCVPCRGEEDRLNDAMCRAEGGY
jgi:hypothetical protein